MNEAIRIEGWALVYGNDDPYMPPEYRGRCLKGEVYGHPRRDDGETIRTSRIVSVDGLRVMTSSGSLYVLGEPRQDYLDWLREHNLPYDPADPIRERRK